MVRDTSEMKFKLYIDGSYILTFSTSNSSINPGVLSFLMSKIEFWIDIKIEINLGELFQTLEYIKGLKVKVKF